MDSSINLEREYEDILKNTGIEHFLTAKSKPNFDSNFLNMINDYQSFHTPMGEPAQMSTYNFDDENIPDQTPESIESISCESGEEFMNMNLNYIDFTRTKPESIYHYGYLALLRNKMKLKNFDIPGFLSYNSSDVNIPLGDIQYINRGSFGYVFSYENYGPLPTGWEEKSTIRGIIYYYQSETNTKTYIRPKSTEPYDKYKVAVKTYVHSNDPEIFLISKLNDIGIDCNIVNAKIMETDGFTIAVMDYMDGSLRDKVGKFSISESTLALKQIAYNLQCLADKNLSYTDLKTGNVLYKCSQDVLKIVLGDIGSICDYGEKGTCTYPPPERLILGYVPCDEPTMVWGLGMIFLELLNHKMNTVFYHRSIKSFQSNIPVLQEKIANELEVCSTNNHLSDFPITCNVPTITNLDELLIGMCQFESNQRITLRDIMSVQSN